MAHEVNKPIIETIKSLNEIERHAASLAARYGAARTLVVFDIDDTLLVMKQDLGSGGWYRWQKSLKNKEPKSEYDVRTKDHSLLDVQFLLYRLSDMKTTEMIAPLLVSALQRRGHPVMALTARTPVIRSATLRELNDFEIHFHSAPHCGPPLCFRRGVIDGSQVAWAGEQAKSTFPNIEGWLTERAAKIRPISYGDGVMMVAGQDKGVMLQLMLASSDLSRYRAIVFVDDGLENVEDMARAFGHPNLEVVILHYTGATEFADNLSDDHARKNEAKDDWETVQRVVCHVFRRFCVAD